MSDHTNHRTEDRRRGTVLWAGGVVAAAILVLGVNGTLSSWTAAIIDNPNNDLAAKGAVALVETGPGGTCDTGPSSTNQVTCNSVNTYGGTATPLDPDGSNTQSVTVNLKNSGTAAGDLVLSADPCASTPLGGSATADPATYPVCTQVEVGIVCTAPSSLDTSGSPELLSAFTGQDVGTLAAGQDTDCTFTLTLPAGTPSAYSSQVATQALHWTLS